MAALVVLGHCQPCVVGRGCVPFAHKFSQFLHCRSAFEERRRSFIITSKERARFITNLAARRITAALDRRHRVIRLQIGLSGNVLYALGVSNVRLDLLVLVLLRWQVAVVFEQVAYLEVIVVGFDYAIAVDDVVEEGIGRHFNPWVHNECVQVSVQSLSLLYFFVS